MRVIIGGLFGTIGALVTHKAAERKRADALFSNALEFMGGWYTTSQPGYRSNLFVLAGVPQHSQLCAEMLIGSAIYLLTESEQKAASHEIFNLHRIMALLKDIASDLKNHEGYKRLQSVIDERIARYEPTPKRGLWVNKSDLATWQNDLKKVTG